MTGALITELAEIGSLKVISRASSVRYKKTEKTLPDIAREVNVDAIVEGTVQGSGDRVRITPQRTRASSDKHLWAKSYERDLRHVFMLERDVAGDGQMRRRSTGRKALSVATTLRLNLGGNKTALSERRYLRPAMAPRPRSAVPSRTSEDGSRRDYPSHFLRAAPTRPRKPVPRRARLPGSGVLANALKAPY